jgi:hypothetical protein
MNSKTISTPKLFKAINSKTSLKQEIYHKTMEVFGQFKAETEDLVNLYHSNEFKLKYPILFEYSNQGIFEFKLKFGSDVLIFFMHTNIFEIPRDHELMKTSYLKEDKSRSYCGIIHIFNFLADSLKYNRMNDIGYLIGRIFVNRDLHYFVEGKREIGLLYNNFATSRITKRTVQSTIKSAILYTLNFDLLTPPYENMKEVTLEEMINTLENVHLRTGKRLGFRFQADRLED